jgi:N6-adenosine-specific RNA methylase IME4
VYLLEGQVKAAKSAAPQHQDCRPEQADRGDRTWTTRKRTVAQAQRGYIVAAVVLRFSGRSRAIMDVAANLLADLRGQRFATILADPPWRFQNKTGKVAPEHRRLARYGTLTLAEIAALPIADISAETVHLYLWVPNALLPDGLAVMQAWGFQYKSNIVWHKIRKDGGSDGRGVGFYFRNVTELVLFGVRGKNARTLAPGRRQVNLLATRKREHSRKPDEQYAIIEACSPGPYLELFSRGTRRNWTVWGNQANETYAPTWNTYAHHSQERQSRSVVTRHTPAADH